MIRRFKTLFLAAMCMTLAVSSPAQTRVEVKKAGTLGRLLTPTQQDTCSALVLSGELDSEDLRVLRRMAGLREEGYNAGRLAFLNLDACEMKKGKTPYMILDAAAEALRGTAVHDGYQTNRHLDMRNPNYTSVRRYEAYFALNHDGDKPVQKVDAATVNEVSITDENGVTRTVTAKKALDSTGDFDFGRGLTESQWKEMKNFGVRKWAGHEIRREGGRYLLYAFTHKDRFPQAAFYKCPNLKILILPRTARADNSLHDVKSPIRFLKSGK